MSKSLMPFQNRLKDRLAQSKRSVGAWLMSSSPIIAEAMASMGFHFLVIDMEHGAADVSQAETLFALAERHGAAPMARISGLDGDLARRLMDLGAHGIIVSTVESAESFAEFSQSCLYPPEGKRGVGISRCNHFGDAFEEYLTGFKPVLMAMVESSRGVQAAAEIASLPSVDGIFLGPYDLSTSLGSPGDFESERFLNSVESVRSACRSSGKALGIHQVEPDADKLRDRFHDGFSFVAYGTDILALRAALAGASEFIGE